MNRIQSRLLAAGFFGLIASSQAQATGGNFNAITTSQVFITSLTVTGTSPAAADTWNVTLTKQGKAVTRSSSVPGGNTSISQTLLQGQFPSLTPNSQIQINSSFVVDPAVMSQVFYTSPEEPCAFAPFKIECDYVTFQFQNSLDPFNPNPAGTDFQVTVTGPGFNQTKKVTSVTGQSSELLQATFAGMAPGQTYTASLVALNASPNWSNSVSTATAVRTNATCSGDPQIYQLIPSTDTAGSLGGYPLRVLGKFFTANSQIVFNGSDFRATDTSLAAQGELRTQMLQSNLVNAGVIHVAMNNPPGGPTPGMSNELDFTIYPVVQPPTNQAPLVQAGADQTIVLPSVANLSGSATDDGLPNPPAKLTYAWSKRSGPGTVQFGNAATPVTTASFSQAGTYVLRLTASDSQLTGFDEVQITVQSAGPTNQAPVTNAGPDQTITLPANANLSGSATDDGLPNPPGTLTYAWTKFSGPGTVQFGNAASAVTTASFSQAGTYVLRLTASDSQLSTPDDVQITVQTSGPSNQAPVTNAGPDQTISLPANANLSGSATDDGLPNPPATLTYAWTKFSGPGTVQFGNAASAVTTASFSQAGTYVLRLTASDSQLSDPDDVQITVQNAGPSNQAPVTNAGPDQAITLPASATLSGSATDDGLPNPPGTLTYAWSVVSGTGTVQFGNAASAATTASFSQSGTYVLRLTAFDGQLSSPDDIQIIVQSVGPSNQAPIVNAGPDQTITTASAALSGSAGDDGLPNPPAKLTYTWSKFSGPGAANFSSPSALATSVTFTKLGVYVLRLTVFDGQLSNSDDVQITVNQGVGSVVITNKVSSLNPGQIYPFHADVLDQFSNLFNTPVTWSNTAGAPMPSGALTAPLTSQTITVTASAQGKSDSDAVTITVTGMGSGGDISNAKAYPVPYKSNSGDPGITFSGLAPGTKIRLFTITGRIVQTLDSPNGADVLWDIKNANLDRASSGVYFYIIEGAGQKKEGKVVVIQ